MVCEFCEIRGKTWKGSDPRCAFETEVFSSDNWNCATMNMLRYIAYHGEKDWYGIEDVKLDGVWAHRDDLVSGSIGVIAIPDLDEIEQDGYIVMTWYKDRSATDLALVVNDDGYDFLTYSTAKKVIEYYAQYLQNLQRYVKLLNSKD